MNIIHKLLNIFNVKKIFTSFKIIKSVYFINYSKYPNYVIDFENKISKKFNCNYSLTFANATIATQTAMKAVGLKSGSKVLVSKLCFPSTFISNQSLTYSFSASGTFPGSCCKLTSV